MNMLSEYVVESIIEEKRREAMQVAKAKHLAESQKDYPKKNIWQLLKGFVGRIWHRQYLSVEVAHPKEHQPEVTIPSPEEAHLHPEKRHLYEQIAQGNTQIEAEYQAQKLQEGSL